MKKKVLSVILAGILMMAAISPALAAETPPPLLDMNITVPFSNWEGIGISQKVNSDHLVTSAVYDTVNTTSYSNTKQVSIYGTSGYDDHCALFGSLIELIPEYTANQHFSVSFTAQTAGVYNCPDYAYICVASIDYLQYVIQNVVQYQSLTYWFLNGLDPEIENGLNHDELLGNWLIWKKIDISTPDQLYNLSAEFTVPQGITQIGICIVSSRPRAGNQFLILSDITMSPIGDTYVLWQQIIADQREQQFQEDVVGDDSGDDDEGSGIRGLIKFIKNLPQWIADKIMGLFIPSDGFFDDWIDDMSDLLSDHFGIIWQAGDILVDLIGEILDFSPGNSSDPTDYDIKFPAASVDVAVNDDGSVDWDSEDGENIPLIPDNGDDGYFHVDLSFFEENETASTIYQLYRAAVSVIFVLGLVMIAYRKFESMFNGGGS